MFIVSGWLPSGLSLRLPGRLLGWLDSRTLDFTAEGVVSVIVEGITCSGMARFPGIFVDDSGPMYATGLSDKLATRNERYCPILGMYRI